MKAMLVDSQKNLVWSEVADPAVGQTEVLVEIHAAALNRADLLQRQGAYPSPKGCPPWMGLEVAGKILEVGAAVTRWKVGDRVCALLGGGGYAEYVAVDEKMVMPIPEGLDDIQAASLPEAYATCYLNLFVEGQYKPGQTLFFPAGASGLASVGIPMAKAFGAYVITTVRTPEQAEKIAPLGADVVIDTSCQCLPDVIRAGAEAGHPVDVAIDCLAGALLEECLPFVNEGCRWVLISTLAGTEAKLPLRAILTKGICLKGSMLRKRSVAEKGQILSCLVREVWPLLESGKIRPVIHKVLPIQQAEQAHEILQKGGHVGKVVLQVKPE